MIRIKLLLVALLPYLAVAGGFQIINQGQKAMSMGGAFTALTNDASSVFYNPGAMPFSEKSMITLGGCFNKPKINYLSPYSGNIEAESTSLTIFHFYFNYKISEKLVAGISVNNPFGSNIKWSDDWEGRYLVQESKLKTMFIQPTLSYMLNENVGFGAGLVFAHGSYNLRKAIPVQGTSPYGEATFKESANSIGFNAGILIKFNEETNLGVNYRSATKFDFKNGEAVFTNIPLSLASQFPSTAKFNSELKLPSVISIGGSYHFTKNLITTVQLDYNIWSVFDSVNIEYPDYSNLNERTGRESNNCITARVGGQYSFTESFDIRIGAAYDQTPVPENYINPELPDADKILLAFGVGYKFNDKLSGDFTFGLENYFQRKGQFIDKNFSGSYKSNITIFGLGLNYNL